MQLNELNLQLSHRWQETPERDRLLVAYVGDAHVLRQEENRPRILAQFPSTDWAVEHLQPVFRELMELSVKPELVILGGDMTDTGSTGEWQRFFKLLEVLEIPYLLTLGNHEHEHARNCPYYHDTLQAFHERGLENSALANYWCYEAGQGRYKVIVVDSLETGELGPEQYDFLCKAVAGKTPTLISCHRPLVKVGNFMDQHRLVDQDFVELLEHNEHVVAVLSGHTHKSCTAWFAKTWNLVSPATCYGIDDQTGYRLLCLAEGQPAWTALRMMPGVSQHDFKGPVVQQAGIFNVESLDVDYTCQGSKYSGP
jgi:3',5'-cyclic AMP phosphodiesterase CpdA